MQRMAAVAPAGCLTVGGTAVRLMEITTMAGLDGRRSRSCPGLQRYGGTERLGLRLPRPTGGRTDCGQSSSTALAARWMKLLPWRH